MIKKTQNIKISDVSKKYSIISTIVLMLILVIFLTVTMFGMYQLNSKIKLTTEHPFVVSRHIGVVRNDVAQMRIRTERLQSYNLPADIAKVDSALNELYSSIALPIAEIQRLYIGPKADADMIANTLNDIKTYQKKLIEFASDQAHTKDDIRKFEEDTLYPLYDKIETGTSVILQYTQNTQMTVYAYSGSLWVTTLISSIIIALTILSGFILFLYFLGKVNKELYAKNQQFTILSHTIDETFLIFDNKNTVADFVADNSMRVIGITKQNLLINREQFYDYMDENAKIDVENTLLAINDSHSKEMSVLYRNPQTQEEQWLLMRFYKTSEDTGSKNIVSISDQTADVRARQNLKDALTYAENANNSRRDFLSRMSHEIRTPMNAIIGMTTIAGASIANQSRVEDCLSKIGYASKHLLMLLNDILDMSKIESNKLAINYEPFDIYQFINSFIPIFYIQAKNKKIEFTEKIIGFSEDTCYLGDPMRLNQVLLNLVSNAIKFTDVGGKVSLEVKKVTLAHNKESIRFILEDNGIGMSEDSLKRIYEPFDQANSSIAQKYGGTGLGMSITKNLVSLMSGHINVKSELGKGTICTVEIPLERSNKEIKLLPMNEITALHVLVVDDEQDMCEHASLLLKKINIRSQWVLSGEEAVEMVEQAKEELDPYDVCFIDWQMPGMDGINTTRNIRNRVGPNTPIIIISAYDWSDIETEARAAGVDAFIAKPLFLSSIYNVLVNVTKGTFGRPSMQNIEKLDMLKNKRILVAEDNELNSEIAEVILQMNGAIVETVFNGKEACEKFLQSEPGYYDAILMDIQMPIMNGHDATKHIRTFKRPDAKTIPIIATTANAFPEDVTEALSAGMNEHISKPIDAKMLCELLSKLI